MNTNTRRFRLVDTLLLCGAILPILAGMALSVLLLPAPDGIQIAGAYILCTIPLPLSSLPITEAQINSWLVLLSILFLCLYLTHGLTEKAETRRQLVAEWIVEKTESLVQRNMGGQFLGFAPFVGAVLALSAFSSLLSLVGLFPPTSDLNVVAGWAILVFFLITYYKLRRGPLHYLKSFAEPVPFLAPLNVINEVATPVSMAFRHYGNILSGTVVSVLVTAALEQLSKLLLGWLPGVFGEIPFLEIGLPALLSVYFDLFSGCLQAFIFAMLTMLYLAAAAPPEAYHTQKQLQT